MLFYRSALLAGIQNFNKSKLKKTQTIDKSKPITKKEPATIAGATGPTSPRGGGGGGGLTASRSGGGPESIAQMAMQQLKNLRSVKK
jgi:hypothetical protein